MRAGRFFIEADPEAREKLGALKEKMRQTHMQVPRFPLPAYPAVRFPHFQVVVMKLDLSLSYLGTRGLHGADELRAAGLRGPPGAPTPPGPAPAIHADQQLRAKNSIASTR